MRLLFIGDLAQTGFGTVTLELGQALIRNGTEVRFVSSNESLHVMASLPSEIRDRTIEVGDIRGWHDGGRRWWTEAYSGAICRDGFIPDAVLILSDPGGLEVSHASEYVPDDKPVYHYVPVEGIGLPPGWSELWEKIQPIAVCKFGSDEIAKVIGRSVPWVYHGVNTDQFYPPSKNRPIILCGTKEFHVLRNQAECKEFLGLDPKRTLILRSDRLVARKNYPSLLRAIAPVLAMHPEADFLWHCRSMDEGGNLTLMRSHFDARIGSRMQPTGFHDDHRHVPGAMMAALYAAADLYVSTSAEGFGLTIAEAMACGTPVVAMDYSSVPEVMGAEPWTAPFPTSSFRYPFLEEFRGVQPRKAIGGMLVPPAFLTDNIYGYWWASVNEQRFAQAVHGMLKMTREQRRQIGLQASAHVKRSFNWDDSARSLADIMGAREAVAA